MLLSTACWRSTPKPWVSPLAGATHFSCIAWPQATRKVSNRYDPSGAGWRCAPRPCCAGILRGPLNSPAARAQTGKGPDPQNPPRIGGTNGDSWSATSARIGSRVAGRASQDLAEQAGVAGRRQGCRASIVRPGMACRWTPDKSEKRRAPAKRAGRPGALSFGAFSLRKQRKDTRPSKGRNQNLRSTAPISSARSSQGRRSRVGGNPFLRV